MRITSFLQRERDFAQSEVFESNLPILLWKNLIKCQFKSCSNDNENLLLKNKTVIF